MAKKVGKLGGLWALWRYLRSRESGTPLKLFCLLAVAYVLIPVDAVSDLVPLVGWLDDLGVVALALGWLTRRYRHSLVERR